MKIKGEFLKNNKQPCNYTGGGLIGINPITIIYPDGEKHNFFDFADSLINKNNIIVRGSKEKNANR